MFKEMSISLEQVLENKNKKIALSQSIDIYWQELVMVLKKNEKKLFKK